jgi:NTP pyrophosphatase (non-canonical NTP hydrolase)
MTISQLIEEYQKISDLLDKKYPMEDKEKRIFARITKMLEEFGELAEVSLGKANLQRDSKDLTNIQQKANEEFADVVSTLFLLGIELDVDIEEAIKKKIAFTKERLLAKEL